MGQAKIRSAEIAALKAAGPKPRTSRAKKHVTAFGAYYHDDQPDGIGIFLSEESEPAPGWTHLTFMTLVNLVNEEMKSTTDANRAERIALAWTNLRENIRQYNLIVFGTPERQTVTQPLETQLSDELIEVFVFAITNIWYLEKQGEIVNDDYNGAIVYTKE